MKNKIMTLIISFLMIFSSVITVAASDVSAINKNTSESAATYITYDNVTPTVAEMIETLYTNEKNPVLKQMIVDYLLVLTGNKQPGTAYGGGSFMIGTYDIPVNTDITTYLSLLGQDMPQIGIDDNGRTVILTNPDEPLNEEAFQKNIDDLEKIYGIVMQVKSATSEMDDVSKLKYIEDYIYVLVPNAVKGSEPIIAQSINNGYCDCDGYSALTYLLGLNCGLDIDIVSGYIKTSDRGHAWNEVVINEVTYWHDTTYDYTYRNKNERPYLLLLPEELTAKEGHVMDNGPNSFISSSRIYQK